MGPLPLSCIPSLILTLGVGGGGCLSDHLSSHLWLPSGSPLASACSTLNVSELLCSSLCGKPLTNPRVLLTVFWGQALAGEGAGGVLPIYTFLVSSHGLLHTHSSWGDPGLSPGSQSLGPGLAPLREQPSTLWLGFLLGPSAVLSLPVHIWHRAWVSCLGLLLSSLAFSGP